MRIAEIEYGKHHEVLPRSETLQSSLRFFRGSPEEGKTIGDMTADDHLILPTSSRLYRFNPKSLPCNVSVCMAEPPFFHGRHYRFLRWFGHRFHRVFTYDSKLLLTLPNARFLAYGTTWVKNINLESEIKRGHISLIASSKKFSVGHRLRHDVVEALSGFENDVTVMGQGYRPFEDKEDGLADFRFSLIIENSRVPAYFTEKLIDCFICRTVPIYWGAPDVAHFFDPRGMIICSNLQEILEAIRTVTDSDYEARREYIAENRNLALRYLGYTERAAKQLVDERRLQLPISTIQVPLAGEFS